MSIRARLVALGAAATICVGGLLTGLPGNATPTVIANDRVAAEKAADYLASQLHGDCAVQCFLANNGMDVGDPGMTIEAAIVFGAVGTHPTELAGTVAFVASIAKEYAGIDETTPGEYWNPGGAAKMATLVENLGEDPTNFGGVDLLAASAYEWEGYRSPTPTVEGLRGIALARAGRPMPAGVQKVVDELAAGNTTVFTQWNNDVDSAGMFLQALAVMPQTDAVKAATSTLVAWVLSPEIRGKSATGGTCEPVWCSYHTGNSTAMVAPGLQLLGGHDADVKIALDWFLGSENGTPRQTAEGAWQLGLTGVSGADVRTTTQSAMFVAGLANGGALLGSVPTPTPTATPTPTPTPTPTLTPTPTPTPSATSSESTSTQRPGSYEPMGVTDAPKLARTGGAR